MWASVGAGLRAVFLSVVLAAVVPSIPAAAQTPASSPSIAKGATPDWVVARSMPAATAAREKHAQDGNAFLLSDWQVRGNPQGYESFFRLASKVVDRSGLESAGKIELSFDPRVEQVTLNFIHVIRDGKVIDRTTEASFIVVEHESDLNDGIISGEMKAIANLKDIRVGDIVDYATTYRETSKLWPGHYFSAFSVRYTDPLALRSIRILWPASQPPLRIKAINADVTFSERRDGDMIVREWSVLDPPITTGESNVPGWYPQYGDVELSSMASWADVAAWAVPLYSGDNSLPAEFEAKLDEIARKSPKAEDRLTDAVRFIEDNIRYVGEELGEGSYVPRTPRTVFERGYGDCKDKSLLLTIALRRLGIEAYPALVSTRPGFGLPDSLPSPLRFDHVIVRATLDGTVMWIDPTSTHSGGRGLAIVQSDLGYALPIRKGQAGLEEIKGYGDHAGAMNVLEQFAVDEDAKVPLTLHVETKYTDDQADWMRRHVAEKSVSGVSEANVKFYQDRFAGLVEAQPLEIRDDRDANVVTMIETYSLSKAAFDKDKILSKLVTRAYGLSDILPDRQNTPRRNPLVLSRFTAREHVIELQVKGRRIWPPDDIDERAEGILFTRKSVQVGDGIKMTYRLSMGANPAAAAARADAVYAVSDKLDNEKGMEFYLDKSSKSAPPPGGIDPAELAPFREDMQKVGELMTKPSEQDHLAALTILNAMGEKVKRPSSLAGLIDGMRGALLVTLNRIPAGKAALLSSVEQYQGNPDILRTLIAVQIDAGDTDGFLKTMKIAAKAQPGVMANFDRRWQQIVFQRIRALEPAKREAARDDFAVVLAEAGWGQTPRTAEGDMALDQAIGAQVRHGNLDAARALLARGPLAGDAANLAIDRRYQAIWPALEGARQDGFRKMLDHDVATAAEAAAKAPDDFSSVRRYIRALREAGRFAQAVDAGRRLAGMKAKIEVGGDDAFWFVNDYAYSLAEAGRVDEAIAQLDGLIALGIDQYPGLISQMINRAEILNFAGRHEQALKALQELDDKYARNASTYGKMWVWAGEACALRELGRAADAGAYDTKLAASGSENGGAMIMAAACRADTATIEKQLLDGLDNADERGRILGGFIHFRIRGFETPFTRKLMAVVDAVRARPAVKAKAATYGRPVDFYGSDATWSSF